MNVETYNTGVTTYNSIYVKSAATTNKLTITDTSNITNLVSTIYTPTANTKPSINTTVFTNSTTITGTNTNTSQVSTIYTSSTASNLKTTTTRTYIYF